MSTADLLISFVEASKVSGIQVTEEDTVAEELQSNGEEERREPEEKAVEDEPSRVPKIRQKR